MTIQNESWPWLGIVSNRCGKEMVVGKFVANDRPAATKSIKEWIVANLQDHWTLVRVARGRIHVEWGTETA